jgi:hypothetical protein
LWKDVHEFTAARRSKPWSASWDKDPKIAKIEKIVCTYFNSGIGDKVRTFMQLMERNPAEYKIKEGFMLLIPLFSSASHTDQARCPAAFTAFHIRTLRRAKLAEDSSR